MAAPQRIHYITHYKSKFPIAIFIVNLLGRPSKSLEVCDINQCKFLNYVLLGIYLMSNYYIMVSCCCVVFICCELFGVAFL